MSEEDPTQPLPRPSSREGARITDSNVRDILGMAADESSSGVAARGWQPPSVEALQAALPQYEITAFVARGGMGAVYKGVQKTLRRTVAIKVLPPDIEDDHDLRFVERFKHEAQSMARLSHPAIVAVFDAGEVAMDGRALGPPSAGAEDASRRLEDQPTYPASATSGGSGPTRPTLLYFVMEFVEGTDVQQLIASQGRLPPEQALAITAHICDALAFAHDEGIIHRDIKPSNIMLDKRGRVKVADFGLAKAVNLESTLLTGSHMAMGTPDFIAPEALIPGVQVDHRADLYAVGVMLYQMLTGHIPRGRFRLPSGLIPQIDPRLDAIVDKAMQTDREHRYSSAIEMRADLDRIATQPLAKGTGQLEPEERDQPGSSGPETGGRPPIKERGQPGPSGPETGGRLPPLLVEDERKHSPAAANKRATLVVAIAAAVIALTGAGWWLVRQESPAGSADAGSDVVRPPSTRENKQPETIPAAWTKYDLSRFNLAAKDANQSIIDGLLYVKEQGGVANNEDPFMDGAVRLTMVWKPETRDARIFLRDPAGPGSSEKYVLRMNRSNIEIDLHSPDAGYVKLISTSLSRPVENEATIVYEFGVAGTTLVSARDGKVLATVQDAQVSHRGGFNIMGTGMWIKEIEYLSLDGVPRERWPKFMQEAAVANRGALVESASSAPAAPEPPAIKLWDSPEKLPKFRGISWEDNAVRLDGKAMLQGRPGWWPTTIHASDMILRAKVRMNPDARDVHLCVRYLGGTEGTYRLGFAESNRSLDLSIGIDPKLPAAGSSNSSRRLASWPLARSFGPDEWLPLELRVVGDELTASADDRVLGTVRDQSIPGPGSIQLYATANGYFRDIEYVSLDQTGPAQQNSVNPVTGAADETLAPKAGPQVAASKGKATATPIKLWDAPEKLPKWTGVSWVNNSVRLDGNVTLHADELLSTNQLVRAKVLMNPESSGAQLRVRLTRDGNVRRYYRFGPSNSTNAVILWAVTEGAPGGSEASTKELRRWPLPTAYAANEWVSIGLQVVGDELTPSWAGRELDRVKDSSIAGPGIVQLFAVSHGYFRDIEYVSLDENPASKLDRSSSP